jgi:phosphoribosylamine--glycine ligase
VRGIAAEGFEYFGVVYVGLILTAQGPRVLEYNVRFGDPECQAILPLLDGDWAETLLAFARGEAPSLKWREAATACVVLAAEGYPDAPVKGTRIEGDALFAGPQGYLLHAGTRREGEHFVVNGGRCMNALGIGGDLSEALQNAYAVAEKARWPGRQMRRDIGK